MPRLADCWDLFDCPKLGDKPGILNKEMYTHGDGDGERWVGYRLGIGCVGLGIGLKLEA